MPEQEVIVGANVFYDRLQSARDNDFDQLGLGVEVLTRWVDARFNYYLPENDRYEIDRHTTRDVSRSLGDEFVSNGFINRDLSESSRTRSFKRYEAALEGWNGEVGFLIPGLDRYAEVRLYAGYYQCDNRSATRGLRWARLEAHCAGRHRRSGILGRRRARRRPLDAGVRVSVPFSIIKVRHSPQSDRGSANILRRAASSASDGEMVCART